MSEELLEEIADKAEELANLARPHSRQLTALFEFAAWIAVELIIKHEN